MAVTRGSTGNARPRIIESIASSLPAKTKPKTAAPRKKTAASTASTTSKSGTASRKGKVTSTAASAAGVTKGGKKKGVVAKGKSALKDKEEKK